MVQRLLIERSAFTQGYETILPNDRPEANDPAVDFSLETIEEFPTALSGLWTIPAVFDSESKS